MLPVFHLYIKVYSTGFTVFTEKTSLILGLLQMNRDIVEPQHPHLNYPGDPGPQTIEFYRIWEYMEGPYLTSPEDLLHWELINNSL